MAPRIRIFIGPSLAHAEARERIHFEAELMPPVVRGDLDGLPAEVEVVGIVDGAFHTVQAVAPREVLNALRRGVRVLGSSSMGALRAAELEPYGMEGVGEVYRMYRDEEIDSDAEVALAFDAETGSAVTEPLVNVRFGLRRAREEGLLTEEERRLLVAVAARIYFYELSYPALLARARGQLPQETLAALEGFVRERRAEIDLKRRDALELIELLNREYGAGRAPG